MAYQHNNRDPNLNNLHHAMELDAAGLPHVRVTLGSDNITITGDVNLVDTVTVNSTPEDPVHTHITEVGTSGILAVPYMPIQGTVTVNQPVAVTDNNSSLTVDGTVSLSADTLSALETINATVSGSVSVSNFPATQAVTGTFWQATQPVSGTVTIQDGGNTITVDGTVNANVTFPDIQKISKDTNANSDTNRIYVDTGLTIPPAFDGEIKNDAGNPIPVSATTAANSALNPIYIAGNVSTIGGSAQGKLWFFQIAQGLIAGHIPLFKAGYNPSVANNTEESIWAHSELYPWSAWGAGGTLSCVSASASDVGTLQIVGLRASDWTEVTETVTMTGVTPVVTTNSFVRVNNVHYSHTSSNVGEIHLNRNGTCVAHIDAGNGQGQMAQYTVPAGYTAYLLTGNANLGKGNDGTGKFRYRLYGSSFQTAMTFLLFQSTFNYTFEAPLALPEKTDLDVTLIASVSGTAVTCAYSMILIQNGL